MVENRNRMREQRVTVVRLTPPDWFGWAGVVSMFLLAVVRIRVDGQAWNFPLLSLGEWLLLPLGASSLTMGLLILGKRRERTLLPLWISAVLPGVVWIAATVVSMLANGVSTEGGDMLLSWIVHLIFPAMAFLPLLAQPEWRDRIMWALAAGVLLNIAFIILQGGAAGVAPPDPGMLNLGGLLGNQGDYALLVGVAVPLIAAWRGGNVKSSRRALATLFCTFLLPALALAACFSWAGLVAVAVGLTISWAAWRSYAFILGIFLCLLIFGYGAEAKRDRELAQRRLLTASADMGFAHYREAFADFEAHPHLGAGPDAFRTRAAETGDGDSVPWYAFLLGGTGVTGLALWLVLLAELGARAMGRYGKPCMLHGGVLGATAALAAAGLWTDALPEGAGALVGFLLAVSAYDESEPTPEPRRRTGKTLILLRRDTRVATRPDDSLDDDYDNKPDVPDEPKTRSSRRRSTASGDDSKGDTIIRL